MTLTEVKRYFKENKYEPRHNQNYISKAINKLSKETGLEGYDLLRLVISNEPIGAAHTHSYGFHTSNGRHLIETFQRYYHEQ